MKTLWFFCIFFVFSATLVAAQVSVNISKSGVRVLSDSGSQVSEDLKGTDSDIQIEGVTTINERVYIDGDEIKPGTSRVTARKSKKKYLLTWGKNGNISIKEM